MGTARRLAACLGLALLAACGGDRRPEETLLRPSTGPSPPPRPASTRTLNIGLPPEQNIFRQMERYRPLARHLSKQLGVTIQLKPLARYGDLVRGFELRELHGAFFGSFAFALAQRRLGVHVLARPEGLDGRSTYFGVVLVRADSGLHDIRALRGKRFAFVDRATTAGYLLPLDLFRNAGIRDYRSFLGDTYFAGTHEDAIRDVLGGTADAGAAKSTVLERMFREDPRRVAALRILGRSPDVPETALALADEVEPGLRDAVRTALLGMSEDPAGAEVLAAFGARRFVPTSVEEYEPVFRFADEVGIDLATFDPAVDRP